ncbi:MAG: PDZ domain-containing protein, partial [Allorhizobium sp.]
DVTLWRDGKATELEVKLGELPAEQSASAGTENDAAPAPEAEQELSGLGLSVRPADGGKGLAIVDVDPDSDAADKGLKAGETITSVNNQEVSSSADVQKVLDQAKKDGRTRALFQVESESGSRFVALPIAQG